MAHSDAAANPRGCAELVTRYTIPCVLAIIKKCVATPLEPCPAPQLSGDPALVREKRNRLGHATPGRGSACVQRREGEGWADGGMPVSYTHLRAHETRHDLVCRLLLEKK